MFVNLSSEAFQATLDGAVTLLASVGLSVFQSEKIYGAVLLLFVIFMIVVSVVFTVSFIQFVWHVCKKFLTYVSFMTRAFLKVAKNIYLDTKIVPINHFKEPIAIAPTVVTRDLQFDATGAYVTIQEQGKWFRINVQLTQTLTQVLGLLRSTDKGTVEETKNKKETMLVNERLFKANALPKFVGTFKIGSDVAGFFSRINYLGQDAFITATHVLTMNKNTKHMYMCNGDKMISVESLNRLQVLYTSPTNALDITIVAAPPRLFSQLGLAVGKLATHATKITPIRVYSVVNDQVVYGINTIEPTDELCKVNYKISTIPGSSGSPLLNTKGSGEIIGIHLEGGLDRNGGVLIPFLKSRKETTAPNNAEEVPESFELNQEEWAYAMMTPEERAFYDTGIFDDDRLEVLDSIEATTAYFAFLATKVDNDKEKGWGEIMEDLDDEVSEAANRLDFLDEFRVQYYKSNLGSMGKHVGAKIKGGRYRKETIHSCSNCDLTQNGEIGTPCLRCNEVLQETPRVAEELKPNLAGALHFDYALLISRLNQMENSQASLEDKLKEMQQKLLQSVSEVTKDLYTKLATNNAAVLDYSGYGTGIGLEQQTKPITSVKGNILTINPKIDGLTDKNKIDVPIRVVNIAREKMKKLPKEQQIPWALNHNSQIQNKINALSVENSKNKEELRLLNVALNTKDRKVASGEHERRRELAANVKNTTSKIESLKLEMVPAKFLKRVQIKTVDKASSGVINKESNSLNL